MRKRLITLIDRADEECKHTKDCKICSGYNKGSQCMNYHIADYLIANGVVVMPCKLRQKVYRTKGNYGGVKIYKGVVDQIVLQDDGQEWFYVYGHPLHFTADDIGKTVFLTREDAERALKGETK